MSHLELYKEVGKRIAAARKTKDVSQVQLAKAIGLARTTVTNIEQGKQSIPLHSFLEICNALDLQPGDLLSASKEAVSNVKFPEHAQSHHIEFAYRILSREGE